MKLLPKQKVNTLVEDQKRLIIEEGVALAKKVDALRVTLAELEKQHALFVGGMELNLKEKTDHLFREIKERETELKLLEIKRKELLKPLEDEWARVREKDATLGKFEARIRGKEGELDRKEADMTKRREEAVITLNHIKIRERELTRTMDKIDQLKTEAEKNYIKITSEKEKQEEHFYKQNRELIVREKGIENYEVTLKQKQEQLEIKENKLDKMKIQLIDQRQTLERAMARIKKKL